VVKLTTEATTKLSRKRFETIESVAAETIDPLPKKQNSGFKSF